MSARPLRRLSFVLLAAAALAAGPPVIGAQSQSEQYRLLASTLAAGGGTAAGPLYRVTGTIGQETVIAPSSSAQNLVQSGFWCFLGTGIIPVILSVNQVPGSPDEVILEWSGNAALYEVDRTVVCRDVASGFLTQVIAKNYTDASPPEAPLVCYSVTGTPGILGPTP